MTKSKSAGKAPAQPTPRAIEPEPLWRSEQEVAERRKFLTAYLKLVAMSAAIYPTPLIRREVIRLDRTTRALVEAERKEFDAALEIASGLDDLGEAVSKHALGSLPAEIANVLKDAPGLAQRQAAS